MSLLSRRFICGIIALISTSELLAWPDIDIDFNFPPFVPIVVVPATDDDGDFDISWSAASSLSITYTVYESANGSSFTTIYTGTGVSKSILGKSDGSYAYYMKACNIYGCSQSTTETVVVTVVVQPPSVPSIPTSNSYSNEGNYTISWDQSTGTVDSYTLEERVNNTGSWTTYSGLNSTSKAFTNKSPNTYDYQVKACNSGGCSTVSGISNDISVTAYTPGTPQQPPSPHVQSFPVIDSETDTFGATEGAFRVNESGASTYSIPITTVPGSGGVAPQMVLSYSSQGGNGIAGMGWSISGGSAISRCRQTLEQDGSGNSKPITLTNQDRLCLDGQRLVLVTGSYYGAAGSTYRTEINSFARITANGYANGFPQSFTVERQDGTTTEYGNTVNSRVEANVQGTPITTVMSWAQNKLTDSTGNYITYSYTENTAEGELLLDSVDYTGNVSQDTFAHIKLNYQTRSDIRVGYMAGSKSSQLKRLSSIESFSGTTLIRSYVLTYEPFTTGTIATNTPSQLAQIEECSGLNGATVCKEPTVFDWHPAERDWQTSLANNSSFSNGYLSSRPADVNGDGKMDLIWLRVDGSGDYWFKTYISNGTNFYSPSSSQIRAKSANRKSWEVIDYDGDGRTDLMYADDYTWKVHLSVGNTLSTTEINTGISAVNSEHADIVDFNGDGLPDILYKNGNSIKVRWMEKATSGIYPYKFSTEQPVSIPTGGGSATNHLYDVKIADFNGDGHVDMMTETVRLEYINNGCDIIEIISWHVLLSNGGKSTANFSTYVSFVDIDKSFGEVNVHAIDINGDGLSDIVHRGAPDTWVVRINTGNGFKSPVNITNVTNDEYIQFTDYDGDGDVDMLYPSNAGKYFVRKWNGTAFETSYYMTNMDAVLSLSVQNHFMDIDGDGHLDHVALKSGNQKIRKAKSVFTPRQSIHTITNGLGLVTEIDYLPLTSTLDFYTKGTGAAEFDWGQGSGIFDILAPMYAVSEARSSSPSYVDANNMVAVQYRYEGLRMQAGGRGSLGFEKLTTIDPVSSIETETVYHQNYPYTGMPESTTQTYGSCVLSSSVNTYDLKNVEPAGSGSYIYTHIQQPYLKTSTETSRSYTSAGVCKTIGTVVTTNAIDNYGNITNINVSNKDANNIELASTTTASGFTNDINNWFLGRLDWSTVTQARPGKTSVIRDVSFDYDPNTGLLTKEIVEPGGSSEFNLTTVYNYDNYGNKTGTTLCSSGVNCTTGTGYNSNDPYSIYRTSQTEYDLKHRFPIKTINAYDQTTMSIVEGDWNALGQPEKVTDSVGVEKDIRYSSFGTKFFERTPAIGTWSRTQISLCDGTPWCIGGATYRIQTTGGGQPESRTFNDVLGRSLRKDSMNFGGDWNFTETRFDDNGRVDKTRAPTKSGGMAYWTTNFYDIFGRLTDVLHPDGSPSGVEYDGLSTTTTNALLQTHTETKNALGDLVSVTDNLNNTTIYDYNTVGKLAKLTDSMFNEISVMTYDKLGRKVTMNDMDKGAWTYDYNAAGELIEQEDAKHQVTKNYYDKVGRLVKREEKNSVGTLKANAEWHYDTNSLNAGLLDYENDTESDYKVEYYYDSVGRIYQKITTIDSIETNYVEDFTYDQYGRPFQTFDASGSGIQYSYQANGYLEKTMDAYDLTTVYSQVNAMDQWGNATSVTLENGAVTTKTFDHKTGRLDTLTTTSNAIAVQSLDYEWDVAGNLTKRYDTGWVSSSQWKNVTERFYYDGLNRLDYNTINGVTEMDISYNAIGNIMSKTGADSTKNFGTYTYGGTCNSIQAGPHAVSSAGSRSYCYDENGNMLNGDGRTLTYTTFDKPSAITKGTHTTSFAYGTGHNRYKRVDEEGSLIITKHYVGNVEIIHNSGTNKTSFKRYIGSSVIQTEIENGTTTTEYVHQDHLGSLDSITKADGSLKVDVSFDAFGVRRHAVAWTTLGLMPSTPTLVLITDTTQRGFTNHEMLDEVGIIHMNGRIYDGRLGRFLQADPQIQEPNNSQSLNRYSYVLNNPLSYTDPTGYNFLKKYWRQIVSIAFAAIGMPYMQFIFGNLTGAMLTGFISGGIASGSLQGAVLGAFTLGAAQYGMAAAAFSSGVSSSIQGGKFGQGFASAGLGMLIGGGRGSGPTKVITSALIGGTISKVTGGKFANGAGSAAFAAALTADWSSGIKRSSSISESKLEYKDKIDAGLKAINDKLSEKQKYETFKSENAATQYLHDHANALAVEYDVEIGARIFKANGNDQFQIGKVVTSYQSGYVDVGQSTHRYFGFIKADWHSHGKFGSNEFSIEDLSVTRNYPTYISTPELNHLGVFLDRSVLRVSRNISDQVGCIVGTKGC